MTRVICFHVDVYLNREGLFIGFAVISTTARYVCSDGCCQNHPWATAAKEFKGRHVYLVIIFSMETYHPLKYFSQPKVATNSPPPPFL